MRRSRAAALAIFSVAVLSGVGIAAAASMRSPALPPAPPAPPPLPPVPDKALDAVEKLLAFEQENPQQFWYNRGFDGETLGTIPTPTDVWFALGQREKSAGLARRDVRKRPPLAQDWARAGVTRLVVGPMRPQPQ